MSQSMRTGTTRRGVVSRVLSVSILSVVLCAAPLAAQELTVDIQAPLPNSANGNTLDVIAKVTSLWDIQSVKATVEGREVFLAPDSGLWKGSLSLAGLPFGPHVLTVMATDVTTATASDQVTFNYDLPPTIELTEPLEASVARPFTRVVASCEDDDGASPCEISVRANSIFEGDEPVALYRYESIDEDVSLDLFDGQQINLVVTATDSAGQTTTVKRMMFVDGSTRLEHLFDVPGVSVDLSTSRHDDAVILDIDSERILYVDESRVPTIRDRDTNIDTPITLPSPGYKPQYGFLSPRGAILLIKHLTTDDLRILEWQDSAPIIHGEPPVDDALAAAGRYAIWTTGTGASTELFLRDLLLGTTTEVEVGEPPASSGHDVDEDGNVVVMTATYDIHRWTAGVATPLATSTATTRYRYPLIDGTTVLYRKDTCCTPPVLYSILRNDAGVETELAAPREEEPFPHLDYEINGDWLAYTKPGASGELNVYRTGPSQPEQQVSFLTIDSQIDTLTPDGQVTYLGDSGNIDERKRYFGTVAPPADLINSNLGQPYLIDGVWYLALGRSFFLIDEAGTPTTVSLAIAPNPSNVGGSVTYTATVPEAGATGLVIFRDRVLGTLGSAPLSGGTAVFNGTTVIPGSRLVYAVYGGDDDQMWSVSEPVTQAVNGTSTTTLTSSRNPSVVTEAVTFTATVTVNDSPGTASGSVEFWNGGTLIGTRSVTFGAAHYTTTTLSNGTHNITAIYLGTEHVAGSTSNTVVQTVQPIGPAPTINAIATSTSSVLITWEKVSNAQFYEVARSVNNGPFVVIATPSLPPFTDNTVSPNLTYLYKVRGGRSGGHLTPYGNVDPATTVMFNRDPILPRVHVIKVIDILELRTAVNAMRAAVGLPAVVWSPEPGPGSLVKALQFQELRAPLNAARTAMGLPAISFVDPTLSPGMIVKTLHVRQLREGCK